MSNFSMKNDLVVKIGYQHNRWILVLRDYDGPEQLDRKLFDKLQERIIDIHGIYGIRVDTLDYIEILGRG